MEWFLPVPCYMELEKRIPPNKEILSIIGKREIGYIMVVSGQQPSLIPPLFHFLPRYLATTNLSLQNNKSPSRANVLRFNLSPKALGHIQNALDHRLNHVSAVNRPGRVKGLPDSFLVKKRGICSGARKEAKFHLLVSDSIDALPRADE